MSKVINPVETRDINIDFNSILQTEILLLLGIAIPDFSFNS